MTESIIVAIITGLLSLAGSAMAIWASSRKQMEEFKQEFKVQQAVTDTKIEELTREVRIHNNFAQRMPLCEQRIEYLTDRMNKLEEDDKK